MRIGFFDSGIGGFSILKEVFELLPEVEVYYIADHEFVPYGDKDREFIINRSMKLTQDLLEMGCDIIVVACNTATAHAIEHLRSKFEVSFVGVEPYINIINDDCFVKPTERGLVLVTKATSLSERYLELKARLDPENLLTTHSFDNLAIYIEKAFIDEKDRDFWQQKIDTEIRSIKSEGFDFLILGCTHYPLVKKMIDSISGLESYSPSLQVTKRIREIAKIEPRRQAEVFQTFFYRASDSDSWNEIPKNYIKKLNDLEEIHSTL